jgi:hypothetical protein
MNDVCSNFHEISQVVYNIESRVGTLFINMFMKKQNSSFETLSE